MNWISSTGRKRLQPRTSERRQKEMFDLWRSEKHKRRLKERLETSAEDRSQAVALDLFSHTPADPSSSSSTSGRPHAIMPLDQPCTSTASSSRKSSGVDADSDDSLLPPWQDYPKPKRTRLAPSAKDFAPRGEASNRAPRSNGGELLDADADTETDCLLSSSRKNSERIVQAPERLCGSREERATDVARMAKEAHAAGRQKKKPIDEMISAGERVDETSVTGTVVWPERQSAGEQRSMQSAGPTRPTTALPGSLEEASADQRLTLTMTTESGVGPPPPPLGAISVRMEPLAPLPRPATAPAPPPPSQQQRSQSAQSSISSSTLSGDICRICHCEASSDMPLIMPCYCNGSLKYVHQKCLQMWIKSSQTRSCEVCRYNFVMQTKLKPIRKWEKLDISAVERRKILCSVTFHIIAITCVVWSLYVLIDRTAEEIWKGELAWPFWTKLVVVAIGFTGGLVFMYVQCKMYVQLFRRWKAYNKVIFVQNCPETVGRAGKRVVSPIGGSRHVVVEMKMNNRPTTEPTRQSES